MYIIYHISTKFQKNGGGDDKKARVKDINTTAIGLFFLLLIKLSHADGF